MQPIRQSRRGSTTLAAIAALSIAAATFLTSAIPALGEAGPQVLYVDPSGGDGAYLTVNDAIAEAGPGDTIELAAGIHYGTINIPAGTHHLTIRGAGEDETIIAPAAMLAGTNNETRTAIVIRDSVTELTLEDFTIDGKANTALGTNANFRDGIQFFGVPGSSGVDAVDKLSKDALIQNVTVRNVDRRGISVYPENNIGTMINNVTVENVVGAVNTGTNGGFGIIMHGSGKVVNSTVRNVRAGISGTVRAGAEHGVEIEYNTVEGIAATSANVSNVGINFWMRDRGPAKIENNSIQGAAPWNQGIYLVAAAEGSTIKDNSIDLNGLNGLGIEAGWGSPGLRIEDNEVLVGRDATGILVTGAGAEDNAVRIRGNFLYNLREDEAADTVHFRQATYTSPREVGIIVSGAARTSRTEDASAPVYAVVSGNTVRNFAHGLAVVEDAPGKADVLVQYNSFSTTVPGKTVVVGSLETEAPYGFVPAVGTVEEPALVAAFNYFGDDVQDASDVSEQVIDITPHFLDEDHSFLGMNQVQSLRVTGGATAIAATWAAPESLPGNVEFEGYIARLVDAKGKTVQTVATEETEVSFTPPSKTAWYRVTVAVSTREGEGKPMESGLTKVAGGVPLELAFDSMMPTVGQALEVVIDAQWQPFPTSFKYTWYANGTAIKNATKSWFVPTSAEKGKEITVRVEGTVSGAAKQTRFGSAGAVVVAAELYPVGEATMSGSPVVGSKLTAKAPAWTISGVKLSYQWYADGAKISKATKNTFTLTSKQQGRHVTVQIVAKKAGYLNGEAVPEPVVVLGKQSPVKPKIAGTAKVGNTLTASTTKVPAGVTVSYQWFRTLNKVTTPIADATGETYQVQAADVNATLKVRATWTRADYAMATSDSAATKKVVVGSVTGATPVIDGATDGTATVGEELSISDAGWAPAPVTLTVQWYRDGLAIPGATGLEYTSVARDLGKRLTVTVTGVVDGYGKVSRTSAAVTIIPAI